ncbi:MAG TPA: calcium-binding protein, partial [Burkholderiales bacterium]|nr:calcium-binding protein [Burkholderiales bacterium]
ELAAEGMDRVNSSVTHTLNANVEQLVLTGAAAIDGTGNALDNAINGNSANNVLTGGGGNDAIDGGAGDDTLIGNAGNDTYAVDSAGDVVTELAAEGTDRINSAVTYTASANVEILALTGAADVNGTGNGLGNALIGNAGANVLDGALGIDQLVGGAGNDDFLFKLGEANGDSIADFAGNGALAGDELIFQGYGAGAAFVQLTATNWAINHSGGSEIIVLTNAAAVHATDYTFI